jgi:glycosyltransferase involved in cell wall biosynthesis
VPRSVILVVPCFDEAVRLDRGELLRLARARPGLTLLLVDDGSRDGTPALLDAVAAASGGRAEVLRLDRNRGKAEAVRRGLEHALARGAEGVGFVDADLSTPVDEVVRLVDELERGAADVLLASRVRLLGRDIERRPARHYLGRAFATAASIALRLAVYDTQCGAKLFRRTPALEAALATPFRSRWIFDVELLDRLLRGDPAAGAAPLAPEAFLEVPLLAWRDVAGSKLRARSMLRAGLQLLALLVRSRLRPRPRLPRRDTARRDDAAGRAEG